jgi:hypothetical protein
MKGFLITLSILMTFVLTPMPPNAQTDQPANSQLSQPLVREGTLAVKLADAFQLGAPANEAEGEDLLSAAGIAPRNGWIADYPLTPDIIGELQAAIVEAADSGQLPISKDMALNTFQDIITGYGVAVKPDISGQSDETSSLNYPDSEVENNYYESEGPPVVTYYAPPPDYAYLYTWVPYPFWWTDFWFPGFFILVDFNVRVHHHDRHRDHDRDRGELVSNHFNDPKTGKITRIDPANRIRGRALPQRTGTAAASTSASGAQAILNKSRGRAVTGATREFRGYGVTQNPVGTRSSAFEHSVNGQVERRASDRGFQSRSSAGQVPTAAPSRSGSGFSGGKTAGGGGFHGGGRH